MDLRHFLPEKDTIRIMEYAFDNARDDIYKQKYDAYLRYYKNY